MVAGLSFRAIVELITSNNESGLRSFLETQHANITLLLRSMLTKHRCNDKTSTPLNDLPRLPPP